jgi:hypothetical protein
LGLRSEALLGSTTFKFVVDYLAESYCNNILGTEPEDQLIRERNFHLHYALNHIVQQLGAYAAAAQSLIQEGQRDDDEPEENE